jgi:hypothetical protein
MIGQCTKHTVPVDSAFILGSELIIVLGVECNVIGDLGGVGLMRNPLRLGIVVCLIASTFTPRKVVLLQQRVTKRLPHRAPLQKNPGGLRVLRCRYTERHDGRRFRTLFATRA